MRQENIEIEKNIETENIIYICMYVYIAKDKLRD